MGFRASGLRYPKGMCRDYAGLWGEGPYWGMKIFRTASGRPACFYVVTRR